MELEQTFTQEDHVQASMSLLKTSKSYKAMRLRRLGLIVLIYVVGIVLIYFSNGLTTALVFTVVLLVFIVVMFGFVMPQVERRNLQKSIAEKMPSSMTKRFVVMPEGLHVISPGSETVVYWNSITEVTEGERHYLIFLDSGQYLFLNKEPNPDDVRVFIDEIKKRVDSKRA